MKICVIGAGYVGLVAALSFASLKNDVICVEKDFEKVDQLTRGIPTIFEEGLEEMLTKCLNKKTILFTTDIESAVEKSDIIFIAVGTPTKEDWTVNIDQVVSVVNQISNVIDNYKVIVTKSTVPIGTQKYIKELLKKNGVSEENFDIVSNPEFLREGTALYDFLNGDRIIIGCDSKKAESIMKKLYNPFETKMICTNPPTAELIKYASNAFLSTKISFINEVANFCSKTGADITTVAYALGLDNRISPKFLKAGIGYGGSCFPKDTKALVKIGEQYDCAFRIIESAIEVNENQRVIPVEILLNHYNDLNGKIISILGLTFKPGTDDTREAPSLYIIEELLKKGAIIKCYDPMASEEIKKIFPNITCYDNIYDSLIDSDCAIVCTDLEEFFEIDLKVFSSKMKTPMLIDGRNMFDIEDVKNSGFDYYYSIGKGRF